MPQDRSARLREFYRRNKRLPSYAEMMKLFGWRSKNSAFRFVGKCCREGLLARDRFGKLIPLRIQPAAKVLGAVSAGFPSPAEEELIDTMSLDEYLIRRPEASFLLKVSGDSMAGAGLRPADLVIVERGRPVKNGDIVVAQVDGEWTMKYYWKNAQGVTLRAANPKYGPIHPRQELIIAGVVVASVRKYHG